MGWGNQSESATNSRGWSGEDGWVAGGRGGGEGIEISVGSIRTCLCFSPFSLSAPVRYSQTQILGSTQYIIHLAPLPLPVDSIRTCLWSSPLVAGANFRLHTRYIITPPPSPQCTISSVIKCRLSTPTPTVHRVTLCYRKRLESHSAVCLD